MPPVLDIAEIPVLFPDFDGVVTISPHGEIKRLNARQIAPKIKNRNVLICHRKWTQARLEVELTHPFDLLELFAFVRPAQFCLPTPAGIASRLGLQVPVTAEDKAVSITRAAQFLIDELSARPENEKQALAKLADMMGRGGWLWTGPVLSCLGMASDPSGTLDTTAAGVWASLNEIDDVPPRGEPGVQPVMPDAARKRLAEMLGTNAEIRHSQSNYAADLTPIFASPEASLKPSLLLAEAGTGIGKTLGYLAPASLWAEANKASVWISTYTRTLQHQIADELSRLHGRDAASQKKVVIRKGRENYLCLLAMEEALGELPGQPANAIALGLMARWASASPDGDLTGASFPAWLIDLIGVRNTRGLADRRGECIHSACPHYHKCFVEKSIRTARQADIVIANHALVMIQAALGGPEDKFRPTRYIFDEGHHVFDAADSAFSSALTAGESAELRRWVAGASAGGRRRARGLGGRLAELISGKADALAALEEASTASQILPGADWYKRLMTNSPMGPAETFFAAVRKAVRDRSTNPDSLYSLQADLYPAPQEVIDTGLLFRESLDQLSKPLITMAQCLEKLLDTETSRLDTRARTRIERAMRGLVRRANGPVAAWMVMLGDLTGNGREEFVDWMQIDRRSGADSDFGLRRHWLDPTVPFAEHLLNNAHGVAITSATLKDESGTKQTNGKTSDQTTGQSDAQTNDQHNGQPDGQPDGHTNGHADGRTASHTDTGSWDAAKLLSGANHLAHPALLSEHVSPFDYARQSRIFIVRDVAKDRPETVAAAMANLMIAADGGALGLFTSIQRLRNTGEKLAQHLAEANIPLYAQHMDQMNLQTLLQLFREDRRSALIGTDAVRDGVDVPGDALRMMIYDRVPWPVPDMLFRARANWQGPDAWRDRITRMKLRQAFGRLIRRADDRGVFVLLDNRLPTRLTSAFPKDVPVVRTGLADAIAQSRLFLDQK